MSPTHAGDPTAWMERIELPAAVNVLALQVIADVVHDYARHTWASYPDIGEQDWRRIVERAHQLTQPPSVELRRRADALLARRANTSMEGR